MKRCWLLEIWKMILLVYGGVIGRRGIIGFSKVRQGSIKSSNFIF